MKYRIRIIAESKDGLQHQDQILPWIESTDIHAALATVTAPKTTESPIEMHNRLVEQQNASFDPVKPAGDTANG
jgi:hypothetical protein